MHISGLAIENFLSYKHANIDFGPRLNIIAGKNGSGKSNIVSALAFVFTKLFDDPKRRNEFSFVNILFYKNRMETKLMI